MPEPQSGVHTLKPTDEILEKWARACHQQHDGHRRALMLSTQATSLAKLSCDTMPETHPSMKDPWLAEQGGPSQSASPTLPDQREQIIRRLKKLVYISGLARMKHEYRVRLADTALEMMNRMEVGAAKGLKGQLFRDYNNHVRSTACICAASPNHLCSDRLISVLGLKPPQNFRPAQPPRCF